MAQFSVNPERFDPLVEIGGRVGQCGRSKGKRDQRDGMTEFHAASRGVVRCLASRQTPSVTSGRTKTARKM